MEKVKVVACENLEWNGMEKERKENSNQTLAVAGGGWLSLVFLSVIWAPDRMKNDCWLLAAIAKEIVVQLVFVCVFLFVFF